MQVSCLNIQVSFEFVGFLFYMIIGTVAMAMLFNDILCRRRLTHCIVVDRAYLVLANWGLVIVVVLLSQLRLNCTLVTSVVMVVMAMVMVVVAVVMVVVAVAVLVSMRVVVPMRALLASDVDMTTLSSMQDIDLNNVENETEDCGAKHDFTTDFGRVPKPHCCLIY